MGPLSLCPLLSLPCWRQQCFTFSHDREFFRVLPTTDVGNVTKGNKCKQCLLCIPQQCHVLLSAFAATSYYLLVPPLLMQVRLPVQTRGPLFASFAVVF